MADPEDRAVERREQIGELDLKVPLQVAIQRGERLVEQNRLRLRAQDTCERHALLLAAGELRGMLFLKPLEAEHANLFRQHAALFRLVAAADAAEDILLHTHVRKQRVLLKEVADLALLRRQIDLLLAVKEHAVAEHDAPAVGRHNARDAL